MTLITDDMRDIIDSAMLSFVATICPDGSPNLSPKGSVRAYGDEHLIFMDIDSPNTIANLKADPRIDINSIGVFRRRGYRFKGTVELLPPGDSAYEWLNAWLLELTALATLQIRRFSSTSNKHYPSSRPRIRLAVPAKKNSQTPGEDDIRRVTVLRHNGCHLTRSSGRAHERHSGRYAGSFHS